ncbi:group I truncated hemoglobin [Streptomyces sp. cg35]|uniref:group I truncated hemoglobin n=1 Tax=Streptomyces sp. cg35 TaxID=3421650 RepID=UPI003D1820E8
MDNTSDAAGSLYAAVGGAPAVTAVVDLFYAKVLADDRLSPHFRSIDLVALKAHQRAFIAAALGGPGAYQGRSLRAAHAPLSLTGADFDRVVSHLAGALTEAGVPAGTITVIADRLTPLRPDIVTGD